MTFALMLYFAPLDREDPREPHEAHLRCAVVRLTEVAEDAGGTRGRHDPAVPLLSHRHPCRASHVERALQVHVDHRVEQRRVHVVEGLVAEDAGVVDHDVDAAERVERSLDDPGSALGRGDRVRVGDRDAAERLDLLGGGVRRAFGSAGAVDAAAEVVDHDLGAPRREEEGVLTAEPSARAGDDRNFSVVTEVSHGGRR